MAHRHRYRKHKVTKHRSLDVPEGFEFVEVEKDKYNPKRIKIVFKKK